MKKLGVIFFLGCALILWGLNNLSSQKNNIHKTKFPQENLVKAQSFTKLLPGMFYVVTSFITDKNL